MAKNKQGMPGKRHMVVRRRGSPTEELAVSPDAAKRNKDSELALLDMSPALSPTEFAELQSIARDATPEQFQTALASVLQKMIVTGLKDIPAPKSIKELESLIRLFRQTSGLEAKEKSGGNLAGGFLPRVVTRRSVATQTIEVSPAPESDLPAPEPDSDLPSSPAPAPDSDLPSFF